MTVATAAPPVAPGFALLRVAAVEPLTPDSVAITFDVPPQEAERFRPRRPGQHVVLRRVVDGQDLRRTYSVCSSVVGGPLRVAARRLDGGAFSTWLTRDLRPGAVLEVSPPTGSFGPRLDPGQARTYGLVAAGAGITPLLSVAASVLDVEPASDVVLVYGNRTARDVMLLEELADLKDRHLTRLQVLHVLSREEQESELLSGRIDRDRLTRLARAGLLPVGEVAVWYLCGPSGMVDEAREALAGLGAREVHSELFHAGEPPLRPSRQGPAPGVATVVVTLHGRTSTVAVDGAAETVLDAVLRVRPDAPYACRGGVCGTCRARVVEGAVEMDVQQALEPAEVAAGVVLTCQARPTTAAVRLEHL